MSRGGSTLPQSRPPLSLVTMALRLSSSKYPCGRGLDSTCQLPFGCIYMPFNDEDEATEIDELVVCLTCLAHADLYAVIEEHSWKCSICGAKNALKQGDLDKIASNPSLLHRQKITNGEEPELVVLLVDANLPSTEATFLCTNLMSLFHNKRPQIALLTFDSNISVHQLGVRALVSADVVSLSNDGEPVFTMKSVKERSYLSTDISAIETAFQAVFGMAVTNTETPKMSRLELLKLRKQQRQIIDKQKPSNSLQESPFQRESNNRKRKQQQRATGEAVQVALDLAASSEARVASLWLFTNGAPSAESTETTLEYFRLLAKTAATNCASIDVFCTGSNNLELPLYQTLVDTSCGHVLSHESYGTCLEPNLEFIWYKTFNAALNICDDDHVSKEWMDGCIVDIRLSSFLNPTHLVGPGEVLDDAYKVLLPNERKAFARGAKMAAEKKIPTHKLPSRDMLETSLTRVKIGRFDPLVSISLMLTTNDFFQKHPHAVVQCISRYIDRDGKHFVTRVYTKRLSIAHDTGSFLESIDEDVIAVLLAKEAVYRSLYGRNVSEGDQADVDTTLLEGLAHDVQADLDVTIQRISTAYRLLNLEQGARGLDLTEEGGVKAAGSSIDFAFPPELADTLRRLYHFRRGPLISPGPMQSIDDRVAIRSLFLRLPVEDCLAMMAPTVWSTGANTSIKTLSLEVMPPETLVLWETSIVVADYFTQLFVWSGLNVSGSEYNSIREQAKSFLVERVSGRFPMPQLHVLNEGDSMSRRFTSILAPSHGDPIEHQLQNFPALASLSSEDRDRMLSKFKFFDPSTDPSFRSWFWTVASAVVSVKSQGVSLCD